MCAGIHISRGYTYHCDTVSSHSLGRSRRSFGNQRSPQSSRSSQSSQKKFETTGTIETIRTIIWKPGLTELDAQSLPLQLTYNRRKSTWFATACLVIYGLIQPKTTCFSGVRQTQTVDLQTCRLADSQTGRLADLQTCRPADLQTGLSQLILKTISCNLRRFPVTHLPLRTFKSWTGGVYFPTCF